MNIIESLILGIVEGITEFLPISSTAHLILASNLLKMQQTEFLKTFEIAIQLGAILSVVVLYWRSLLVNFKIMTRIAAAFIPTAIIGLILYKIIKHFFFSNIQIVLWALFAGGIFLIIFELLHKEKENAHEDISSMSFTQAVLIGVFQSLAVVPGVSRAAATIIGGLILGLKKKAIVEFSFLLAVPTMLAAVVLDLYKSGGQINAGEFKLLAVGFVVSFVVALAVIKFLLYFIKEHSFISFGIYRVLLALVFWMRM